VVELSTPLPVKGLTMMVGAEGGYLMTWQKDTARSWDIFNHDIYLQFGYSLPQWRFTAGHRVLFYNYRISDSGATQRHMDIRNNTNVSVIYLPHYQHQIQLGYYRKFYNPAHAALLQEANPLDEALWATTKGQLTEKVIHQLYLSYAYSRQKLTVQADGGYYFVENDEGFGELKASVYWKTKWVTLMGGANLYIAKSKVFASLRVAPTAYLPKNWQIAMQVVYYTPKSPVRELYGTPVYGCLSVSKQIGKFLNLGVDWHDMFDNFCSTAKVNRHAATIKVQYRF